MSRAFTGYVSRYQRSRVWSQEFYRTEKFTLIADFTGALLDGVTIESAVWQSFNNANVILGTAVAFEKKTEVECTAGLEPGSAVKVEVTLSDGSIMNQLFAVNVRSSPWFCEDTVPAQGPCHVTAIVYEPSLTVEKSAIPSVFTAEDDVIQYYYTVTNTGNVEITDVTVTDDLVDTISCPSTTLDVGETMVCTGFYTITAGDVTAGEVTNAALVIATGASYVAPNTTITVTTDTELTITDFGISGNALDGVVNDVYAGYTYTAEGGEAPLVWTITGGSLPTGLTINSGTGALAGTPTVAGTFNFEVTATDDDSLTATLDDEIFIADACYEIDYETNLYFAGGVNRVISGYSGNLIRVRRSSDNAELDIGQDVDGSLDVSALETFCAATNGFVSRLYKQAGTHTLTYTAPDVAAQPAIVTAGTYLNHMQLDGTTHTFSIDEPTSIGTSDSLTVFMKTGIPTSSATRCFLSTSTSSTAISATAQYNRQCVYWVSSNPSALVANFTLDPNAPYNNSTWGLNQFANGSNLCMVFDHGGAAGDKLRLWVNGFEQMPTPLEANATSGNITNNQRIFIGSKNRTGSTTYSACAMNLVSFLIYTDVVPDENIQDILSSLNCRYP